MLATTPKISFSVYRKRSAPDWLTRKRLRLEKKWKANNDGQKLVRKILRTCRLDFPNPVLKNGVNVVLYKYVRKRHGDLLGSVSPRRPRRISLYVEEKDRYSKLKTTLCHELLHVLMWSCTRYDYRRVAVSLFADVFANELLVTILEELIMKGEFGKVDFQSALNYARSETIARLKNLRRERDYETIIGELKIFLKDYRKAIREGSNVLKERQRALRDILSPLDPSLDE